MAAAQTLESPDALYQHREDLPSARKAADIWESEAASGHNFEASWKLSRACYWLGTEGPEKERHAALERGQKAGEQATALEPSKPEGHFWLAANLGELAQSGSMFAGLKYKGRIKDELEKVLAIDPGWQQGSADRALGEWYAKVPGLFGGSKKKAEEHLRKSLTYNAESSSSLYFLAEVLADDGQKPEARDLLAKVLQAPIDPEWQAEDREFKVKAEALLKKLAH